MNYMKKSLKRGTLNAFCVMLIIPVLTMVVIRMESEMPYLKIDMPIMLIDKTKELTVDVKDRNSGIKRLWLALYTNYGQFSQRVKL